MKHFFAVPDEVNLDHLIFSDDPVISAFAQWLTLEAGPDEWHLVADDWDWERGEDPLWWIVTRPNCDRATALTVFWATNPQQYLGCPLWQATDVDGYDLCHTIRTRWAAGLYTRSEIAFDIDDRPDPIDFAAYRQRYGQEIDVVMPPDMRRLKGRRLVDMDYVDGIPTRFWEADAPFDEEEEDA